MFQGTEPDDLIVIFFSAPELGGPFFLHLFQRDIHEFRKIRAAGVAHAPLSGKHIRFPVAPQTVASSKRLPDHLLCVLCEIFTLFINRRRACRIVKVEVAVADIFVFIRLGTPFGKPDAETVGDPVIFRRDIDDAVLTPCLSSCSRRRHDPLHSSIAHQLCKQSVRSGLLKIQVKSADVDSAEITGRTVCRPNGRNRDKPDRFRIGHRFAVLLNPQRRIAAGSGCRIRRNHQRHPQIEIEAFAGQITGKRRIDPETNLAAAVLCFHRADRILFRKGRAFELISGGKRQDELKVFRAETVIGIFLPDKGHDRRLVLRYGERMIEKTMRGKLQRNLFRRLCLREPDIAEIQLPDAVDAHHDAQVIDSGGNRELAAEQIPLSARIRKMKDQQISFGKNVLQAFVLRFVEKRHNRIPLVTDRMTHPVTEAQLVGASVRLRKLHILGKSAGDAGSDLLVSIAVFHQIGTFDNACHSVPDLPFDGFLHIPADRGIRRNRRIMHMAVIGMPAERIIRGFLTGKVSIPDQVDLIRFCGSGKPRIRNFLKIKSHAAAVKRTGGQRCKQCRRTEK